MKSNRDTIRRQLIPAAAALIAAATLSACADDCFAPPAPNITVTVTDSATGLAPSSAPLVLVWNGVVEDTLTPNPSPPPPVPYVLMFSSEAAVGVYRITVSASGYQTFVRDGVRIESREYCGLNSQATIDARLQPIDAP